MEDKTLYLVILVLLFLIIPPATCLTGTMNMSSDSSGGGLALYSVKLFNATINSPKNMTVLTDLEQHSVYVSRAGASTGSTWTSSSSTPFTASISRNNGTFQIGSGTFTATYVKNSSPSVAYYDLLLEFDDWDTKIIHDKTIYHVNLSYNALSLGISPTYANPNYFYPTGYTNYNTSVWFMIPVTTATAGYTPMSEDNKKTTVFNYQYDPLPSMGPPYADFECNNDWRGETSPFDLACINNGYNYTEDSCSWTVYYPNSTQTYSDSVCDGFDGLTLTTAGFYGVGLYLCNDSDECDFELKENYITILGALPQPNVTPTVVPNTTPIVLISTLQPTLQEIINRTEYRSTIESTVIGNITSPYLDFVDNWTDSLIAWLDQLSENINWPLVNITSTLEDALEMFQTLFDSQYTKANLFMYWIGIFFAMIPESVMALISYKLIIEILKAVLET